MKKAKFIFKKIIRKSCGIMTFCHWLIFNPFFVNFRGNKFMYFFYYTIIKCVCQYLLRKEKS